MRNTAEWNVSDFQTRDSEGSGVEMYFEKLQKFTEMSHLKIFIS